MLQEVTCVKLVHQPLYDLDELNSRTPSFNLKHLGKFLIVIIKMQDAREGLCNHHPGSCHGKPQAVTLYLCEDCRVQMALIPAIRDKRQERLPNCTCTVCL